MLHSVCQQICKTQQWPQNWKRSVFISIPKKGNVKECSNILCAVAQLLSFHMLARLCSKSFKLGFNSMWTKNFQMCKMDLEKAEEPEIKLQHPLDHRKSKRVPEKHLLLLYWLRQSLWLSRSQKHVENSSRDGNTRPPYPPPEKSLCRARSNS